MPEPTLVHQVELSAPPVDVATDHAAARVLVRLHGMPLGFLDLPVADGVLTASAIHVAAADQLDVAGHLVGDGLTDVHAPLPEEGFGCRAGGPYPAPPGVSVVLCTRDREELLRTALTSVIAALGPADEVVVVDNAPGTPATRSVVADLADPRVRYVLEARQGLSVAHNSGARAARGALIAFTDDDDVVVDADWVAGLTRGFTRAARVGCVLDWFVRTLHHGFALAYEPGAIVWHRHRRDLDDLRDQLYGYGTGLTAYLFKHALTRRGAVDLSRRLARVRS